MVAESSTIKRIAGKVIATDGSFEEYLDKYAGDYCELVEGNVIKMSPAPLQHNMIWKFIYMLLGAYFELKPIGKIITQPFPQRLENVEPTREPDLMVILNEHSNRLKPTVMDGAADICIEVVSPESVDRDHGEKLSEYEKGV